MLDRVGADGDVTALQRARIRAEVLSEFDRSVADTWSGPITPITMSPAAPSSPTRDRSAWTLAAAAAIICVVVAGLVFVGDRDPAEEPVASQPPAPQSTPASAPVPFIDELLIGLQIAPGRYATAVAGGLSFELPEGVTLVAATDSGITLGLAGIDASISILAIEDVSSLESAIDSAAADGLLRVERSAGVVGDRPIVRRDLTLTTAAIEQFDCVVGEPCDVVPATKPGVSPLALRSGAENFATVLALDGDVDVAIVEQFTIFGSPTSAVANSIIKTLEPATG